MKAVRLPEVVFAETDELSRGLLWVGAAEKESDTNSNNNAHNANITFGSLILCPLVPFADDRQRFYRSAMALIDSQVRFCRYFADILPKCR